ncbi:MAG: BlaI/MecI/CopY family transcriptional regulator [Gaiellaceae bacterium]
MPSFDRRSRRQRTSDDPIARYLGGLQAEVMGIFWDDDSATVREVVDELNKRRRRRRKDEFAYTTVLTIVSRLYTRELLDREPEGRGFRYHATTTRDELLGTLSDELISRLLDDFGEIAVARLGARLDDLDPSRLRKLKRERGR